MKIKNQMYETTFRKNPEEFPRPLPYMSGPNEISAEDYHRNPLYSQFISSTALKNYLISPKHAQYYWLNPPRETEAKSFGSLYHDLLAAFANTGSIDTFLKDCKVFSPPINLKTGEPYGKTTKAYQEALAEQSYGGRLVNREDLDLAKAMIEELLSGDIIVSRDIEWLLKLGVAEVSGFININGYGFKYRKDLDTDSKIIDWKTTTLENPKPEEWSREIVKYGYHISAAGRNIRGSFSTFIGQDLRAKGCYGMFHGDGVVIGLSEKVYNELYSVVRQAIAEAETDENWQQLMAMRAKAEAAEEEYKKHVESVEKMMTLNGRTY